MKQFDNSTPHLSSVYDSQILNTIPYYDCFHREAIGVVKAAGIQTKGLAGYRSRNGNSG